MSKAILLGPYVGSFTQEVLVFRPHIRYITETVGDTEVFVSSHSNRSFLYDWIEPNNFLPIYEHISRNEPCQTGFTYSEITKTEFNQITKKVRGEIPHDTVEVHALPYVKNTNGISFYQKIYTPFNIPEYETPEDIDIVGIFDQSDESKEVYEKISKICDIVVIGDMNNGLETENLLMKNLDFSNNYLKMFNFAVKSKLVVTNCPEWVLICNLQDVPVFYWGGKSSLFKDNGTLRFDSKKCTSICDMDADSIASMVSYCYERLYG